MDMEKEKRRTSDWLMYVIIAALIVNAFISKHNADRMIRERDAEIDSLNVLLYRSDKTIARQRSVIDKLDTIFFYHIKLEQPKWNH